MKLVSYLKDGHDSLAVLVNRHLYDMELLHPDLPNSMNLFLAYWDDFYPVALEGVNMIEEGRIAENKGISADLVQLLAPVPYPSSCREGDTFRQHLEAVGRSRGTDVAAFEDYPVFCFINHQTVQGPGKVVCMPDHLEKLDFGLEAAIVICKAGKNIRASAADEYIGGLMIMNGFGARALQAQEVSFNPSSGKGRDFATTVGPYLVTLDELETFETAPAEGHNGKAWNLQMTAAVNGQTVSEGRLSDMYWTFAELIEQASYGVELQPGDIIGSGIAGTGCFLGLNEAGKQAGGAYTEQWLRAGDEIKLAAEGLGHLTNTVVADESDWSLLQRRQAKL